MKFKPSCIKKQREIIEGVSYREFNIWEFGSPKDESMGPRHQKSWKDKLDLSHPLERGHVSWDHHIEDLDIGGQNGKSFDLVSGEVTRRSEPSIWGEQVAEINGSTDVPKKLECRLHELRASQGESPRVGCSKSRSCEITRSKDGHWIERMGGPLDQEPHRLSRIRRFRGWKDLVLTAEVMKCRESRHRGNMRQNHKVGSAWLAGGHVSPRKRSQHSVDLSRLGRLQQEGMRVQPTNSRRCELWEALVFKPNRWSRTEGIDKRRIHTRIGISCIAGLRRRSRELRLRNLRDREVATKDFGIGPWS